MRRRPNCWWACCGFPLGLWSGTSLEHIRRGRKWKLWFQECGRRGCGRLVCHRAVCPRHCAACPCHCEGRTEEGIPLESRSEPSCTSSIEIASALRSSQRQTASPSPTGDVSPHRCAVIAEPGHSIGAPPVGPPGCNRAPRAHGDGAPGQSLQARRAAAMRQWPPHRAMIPAAGSFLVW